MGTEKAGQRQRCRGLRAVDQRQAFLGGENHRRQPGFRQRLEARGARPMLRDSGMWSIEEAMNATRRLMALPTPPDALFCANDMMAIAALNVVVGEMGMKAGEDISVVGFDDIAMASWPLINLTTWVQPLSEMVDTAIAVLKTQLGAAETTAVQHVLQGKLVVRGSTRPLR